jgi:hypothetical protein
MMLGKKKNIQFFRVYAAAAKRRWLAMVFGTAAASGAWLAIENTLVD